MLGIIDIMFLVFVFVTMFFSFLFLVLYLEHRKRDEKIKEDFFPTVSVVIPAFNEEKTILSTINAIKNLNYPNLSEIIVVDDGSSDKTRELAESAGVKVLTKENQGQKSFPLNFALPHVKGKIMACVDADSYPEPNSLRKAVPFFKDEKVASVTTSVYVRNAKTIIERLQSIEYVLIVWARKLLELLDSIYVTPGALSLYRTDILRKIGGFDDNNITEDIEIAWRFLYNGYKIKMSLDSEVCTGIPPSFKDWGQQRVRWAIGGIQTTLKYIPKLFKSKESTLTFAASFFVLSYSFSIVGFFIFIYIIYQKISEFLYYFINAYMMGTGVISRNALNVITVPNIFATFGLVILILAIVWVAISYRRTGRNLRGIGDLFDLILYLSLYITLFPAILIYATTLLLMNKIKW